MATLSILSEAGGPLTHITVSLGIGRLPERSFYGLPEFMEELTNDLPSWKCGRLQSAQTPQEQMDAVLERWIPGRLIRYDRMFKDLMPASDEVWEFKTADLRIFGWLYRPRVFIAAHLGYADSYKPPTATYSYHDARDNVVAARNKLDLDEPKFVTGVFDDLV